MVKRLKFTLLIFKTIKTTKIYFETNFKKFHKKFKKNYK